MKLNFKSWFVRYWVFLPTTVFESNIPRHTNLCKVFWQTVLVTPIFVALSIAIGPLILAGAGLIWVCTKVATWIGDKIGFSQATEDKVDVVFDYLSARKKKVCPLITIERDDDE